jgi:uncharacterized protein YbjQ (UPF0145 family)
MITPTPIAGESSAAPAALTLARRTGLRGGGYPRGAAPSTAARVLRMAADAGLPMTTAFELPGVTVTENLGVCYGLVVRSLGVAGGLAAGFQSLRRGELGQYTQLLEESRRHALDRLVENAALLDADAIIAVRFDSSEIGNQLTEIVAYGTAVKVRATA